MSTEKQRQQNRERQQRFRDKKRNPIPDAWDYQMPDAQSEQLNKYAKDICRAVSLDLYPVSATEPWPLNLKEHDHFIVDGIAAVTLALEKQWAQPVNDPCGILTGNHSNRIDLQARRWFALARTIRYR